MKTVYERWREEIDGGKRIANDVFDREFSALKEMFHLTDEMFETAKYAQAKTKLYDAAAGIGAVFAGISSRNLLESLNEQEFNQFVDEAIAKQCEPQLLLVAVMTRDGKS